MNSAQFQQVLDAQLRAAIDRYGADLPLPAAPGKIQAPAAPDPLADLASEVSRCTRCALHQGRNKVVFGEGSKHARVMFIGEAPGAEEDRQGRPFVGRAGQLLTAIIEKGMHMRRDEVFIANVNKCRPPGNRDPEAAEVAACLPYLQTQVRLIAPEVIVALGRVAAQNLLGSTQGLGRMRRGRHFYQGIPVVVTWHPAYLLRQPSAKRDTWEDIKRVLAILEPG